ncbi:hypothetical protein SIO17_20765 [Pseudoalteromonas piscicida]|uniref:RiboL-PSP-HEPN domain-containing protein n=1 Tax=Pseudoalteromonas piscicida TaxID=43662 RepID=A0ABM6NKI9_PSEO7|nr:hypothetical protein [Pseudoalteromonas piscicida]ATD09532.1 hypothetical protein PPIS_b0353 [Pseudoalteromonas piscicida]WPU31455.1 hypothetical protein SIO17_20765 [Pseudoalteromonas piscicida]
MIPPKVVSRFIEPQQWKQDGDTKQSELLALEPEQKSINLRDYLKLMKDSEEMNIFFNCTRCCETNGINYTPTQEQDLIIVSCEYCKSEYEIMVFSDMECGELLEWEVKDGIKYTEPKAGYYTSHQSIVYNQQEILNTLETIDQQNNTYITRLLFAQAIVNLETYLSDTFRFFVLIDQDKIHKSILNDPNLRKEKFTLEQIIKSPNIARAVVKKEFDKTLFHNLAKVCFIYKNSLGVNLPEILDSVDRDYIQKCIEIRHDIVHRNGKDSAGDLNKITKQDVTILVNKVSEIIKQLDSALSEHKNEKHKPFKPDIIPF